MRKKTQKNELNIRRVDTCGTCGWQFHSSRGGKIHTKLFSDSIYGGCKKALAAARDYREFYINAVPKSIKYKLKNQFGVSGMSYYTNSANEVVGVQCTTKVDGKFKTKKFRQLDGESFDSVIKRGHDWKKEVST